MSLRQKYSRISFRHITNGTSTNSASPIDVALFDNENLELIKSRLPKASTIRPPPKNGPIKRWSAVLVPLIIHKDKPAVLFTVRSNQLYKHRGEISFPGGSLEEIDEKDHVKAALRETHEEIGVAMNDIRVLGEFPATAGSGTSVIPVLGVLNDKIDVSKLAYDVNEVSEIFASSIDTLCQSTNQSFTQYRNGYSLPIFYSENGHKIWGLTAIILHQVLRVLAPAHYKPRIKFLRAIKL